MAPSQVSGMKMRNLFWGVILGLAVVHSTPVNTVNQIPAKAEDDVLREAMTDGFLIDHPFLPSLMTESPKRNTTVQASQKPSSDMIKGSAEGETLQFIQHGGEHYATTTQSVSRAQSITATVLTRDTDDSSSDSSTTQSHSKKSDMIEGSAEGEPLQFVQHGGEHYATTTQSVSRAQSITATVLTRDTDDSSSDSSTTQSPQISFSSSSVPNEAQSSVTPDHISVSQTTDPAVPNFDILSTLSSDLGSGKGEKQSQNTATSSSTTSSSNTDTSTASSTAKTTTQTFEGSEKSGKSVEVSATIERKIRLIEYQPLNNDKRHANPISPQNNEHSTPGWIIIVGFIVGVAALVILSVAIATRDKWNGPGQASQLETKTNSSNQKRELEMETFLHKDNPRENGKAKEYTVIPLDELPEKMSSH